MGKTDLQLHREDDRRSRRSDGPLPGCLHESLSGAWHLEGPRSIFIVALSDGAQRVLFEIKKGPGKNFRRTRTRVTRFENPDRKPPGGGKGVATFARRPARGCRAESISEFEIRRNRRNTGRSGFHGEIAVVYGI